MSFISGKGKYIYIGKHYVHATCLYYTKSKVIPYTSTPLNQPWFRSIW